MISEPVEKAVAILISMMSVLRYAPPVDSGTVKAYCWALSPLNPTKEEIEQVARQVMMGETDWAPPAVLISKLKALRAGNINVVRALESPTAGMTVDDMMKIQSGRIGRFWDEVRAEKEARRISNSSEVQEPSEEDDEE